jgi:hypothetical protein
MIGDLEKATFSNIEHQSLDFVVHSLMPWLKRWEATIHRDLLGEDEKDEYFAEFLVDGLLRGDVKSRYEAYQTAIINGWMNRNEVREKENMNPADGLDEYLVPLNMAGANEEPPDQNNAQAQAALIVEDSAARLVRREISEISKRADRYKDNLQGLLESVGKFYVKHAQQISETLHIPRDVAGAFCEERKSALVLDGVDILAKWEAERGAALSALVLGGKAA